MFEPEQLPEIRRQVREQAELSRALLERLVAEARGMAGDVRVIKARNATSVALMASDGGNNKIAFNPFYLQMVRVVDSNGKELLLEVVSPESDIDALTRRQFEAGGTPRTALGRMMADLGVRRLQDLSPMMSGRSRSWVRVFRELCEWASMYDLVCNRHHATHTLIVHDGLLRSTVFRDDLFVRLGELMHAAIQRIHQRDRCRVWLAGVAKKSQVLEYYRLAISLSRVLDTGGPCFVKVPRTMQENVYTREEYIRDVEDSAAEKSHYNIGSMYFVRFGPYSGDPVWTVDLLSRQDHDAQTIFGYLLADAVAGFPVPFYPNCLQQADAFSRVADFDMDIVEDQLVDAVREQVSPELAPIVDALRLSSDVAARRYE